MKIKFIKSISYLWIFIFAATIMISSCNKEPEAMTLPPFESLSLDVSKFPSPVKKSEYLSRSAYNHAAYKVFVMNAVVIANVALPVLAYREALDHSASYLGDNMWKWSYEVTIKDTVYEASLIGTWLDEDWFSMEMSLSQQGGYQNFKWFYGEIKHNHTEANWTLYRNPADTVAYLGIEFQKDFTTDIGSIKYEVIDEKDPYYAAYIEYGTYGTDPSLDFDSYYTVYNNDSTINIEWNTISGAGRVKSPFFKDSDWHCWDSSLNDVECAMR